jgi:hypothetical protein
MKACIKGPTSQAELLAAGAVEGLRQEFDSPLFALLKKMSGDTQAGFNRTTGSFGMGAPPEAAEPRAIVTKFIHNVTAHVLHKEVKLAQAVAQDTADDTMANFFIWVATNFMSGEDNTPVMGQALAEAGVSWKPLSEEYISQKDRLGLASGYWRFKGRLARQFASRNSRRRRMFGKTTFDGVYRASGTRVEITINPVPELDGVSMSSRGIENQIIVDDFGGADTLIRKLQGRLKDYRPLLGPALTYYIRHVVRAAVAKKLNAAGLKVKKGGAAAGVATNQ